MQKRILAMLLVLAISSLLCKQVEEGNLLLPSEKDTEATYRTSNLIYQNSGSTSYPLGGIDNIYTKYESEVSFMLVFLNILIPLTFIMGNLSWEI